MAANVLPHGEIIHIHEILTQVKKPYSVRVVGRVEAYDASVSRLRCRDTLTRIDSSNKNDDTFNTLEVDTSLIEPFHLNIGDQAMFVGEIHQQQRTLILRARVYKQVNDLDMNLYAKALEIRRQFLQRHTS